MQKGRVLLSDRGMKRFWLRLRKEGACWVWTGSVTKLGYAIASVDGVQGGHLVSWIWKHGSRPATHLRNQCGQKHCVNPAHWKPDPERPLPHGVRLAAEIENGLRDGLGIGETALAVGCSRTTVWRYAREINIGPPE